MIWIVVVGGSLLETGPLVNQARLGNAVETLRSFSVLPKQLEKNVLVYE